MKSATFAHAVGCLVVACVVVGQSAAGAPLEISGIYPHLATHNQPADVADRPHHGECGIGAIVPWADRLWYITYPQHKTTGSNDKLYEVDPELNLTIRPESVGGTHACRMIHRESNQLIIGPYFIDAKRNVRSVDLHKLRGRMTAVMRHLVDPANKVYFFDMEGAIYEVDVHTLAVTKLFDKPVPGWHGKGGYTAQHRVVIANNGERDGKTTYKHLLAGGPAVGEEAGVLAEWNGADWSVVERKQFTDVTGPGGIYGSPNDTSPLWAIGWDKRSVILKLLDGGVWSTFRMPKASHTFDPRHGWYTEWPRIREIAPGRPMMCMHGGMFDFPITFSAKNTAGIRPLTTHLRYIPDFCYWQGRVVLGADDASMMANPMCGQAQSNLWFGTVDQLIHFGPRAGWGGVWLDDPVRPGEPSVPYLLAGYDQRVVHFVHDQKYDVHFRLETSRGDGNWATYETITVPAGGYRFHIFPADVEGDWVRVSVDCDCRATAYFHYWSERPDVPGEASIFDALADADSPGAYTAGLIRPAAHNTSLQWLAEPVSAQGTVGKPQYLEVDVSGRTALDFSVPQKSREDEVRKIATINHDFEVDAASVIVTTRDGRRYRLPKGSAAFDDGEKGDRSNLCEAPSGPYRQIGPVPFFLRGVRECVSERFLANLHGTFYEIPRAADNVSPDFEKIKPVASHHKLIADFCTWRGLLVLCGTRADATPDGHFFAGNRRGLWFGAIDDLWKLGKPVGHGGPWLDTPVQTGQPSDPYLMTGYDRKQIELRHDRSGPVTFTVEVDFDHTGFRQYGRFTVPPGEPLRHTFASGFHAHWLRLLADQPCRATALLEYR